MINENLKKLHNAFNVYQKKLTKEELPCVQDDKPYKLLKKLFADLESVFLELGLWSFAKAFENTRLIINTKSSEWRENPITNDLALLATRADLSVSNLLQNFDVTNEELNILENSSQKVKCLVDLFQSAALDTRSDSFHSIVFVDRKSTAIHLNNLFCELSKKENWTFLISDYLFGDSACSESGDRMTFKKQVDLHLFFIKYLV